jgi:hypothetical protein
MATSAESQAPREPSHTRLPAIGTQAERARFQLALRESMRRGELYRAIPPGIRSGMLLALGR